MNKGLWTQSSHPKVFSEHPNSTILSLFGVKANILHSSKVAKTKHRHIYNAVVMARCL